MLPNQNTDGSYICTQYLSHQTWRMRELRRYRDTLRPTYGNKKRTWYPLPIKLGSPRGWSVCAHTCRAQHPLVQSVAIPTQTFLTLWKITIIPPTKSHSKLYRHTPLKGPMLTLLSFAPTFTNASIRYTVIYPRLKKKKILSEWALKFVGGEKWERLPHLLYE